MSGDDDAWRDAARGLGLDPADPDVAELFQCSRTPEFALAELRRRQAERKGKALGVREVDEDEEGLPGPKGRGRKG